MRNTLLLVLAAAHASKACERHLLSRQPEIQHDSHAHKFASRQIQGPVAFPPKWTPNEKVLHESFSTADIDRWSHYFTHGNHVAGLNKSMAEATAAQWNANGVPAQLVEYEVFLNYPKEQKLLLKSGNETIYEAQMHEDVLIRDETTGYPNALPNFHGYSASGHIEAEYVYAGRGTNEDFQALRAANISLQNKIAVVRYGGPFRGAKVLNAEGRGMAGVITYSDPGDDLFQVKDGHKAYPDGPARNPSSVQRGSVGYINYYPGDPTTPGRPSKPGVYRVEPTNVPRIPSVPISYRDALPILKALDGHGKPGNAMGRGGWVGGLNVTYSTGPAPGVKLSLTNLMEEKITPIWNVIGLIEGTNPNETVIIGNHRDAWSIGGAADPNSGSAIVVESTKAFGDLLKTGWKPVRNIMFASWDAEEYALIGSTEFVEEFAPFLSSTAITYLNIDIAVQGPLPGAGATPEIRAITQEVMKQVVYESNRTLYDAWYALNQFRPEDNGFSDLGSGSDYVAFLQLGIGALDFGMDGGRETPTYHYHSNYDSYHWMKMIDPDFSIHATVGRFITLLAYRLANDALLPLDMSDLARNVNYMIRDMVVMTMSMDETARVQDDIGLIDLDNAGKRFANVADEFVKWTKAEGFLNDTSQVKEANAKLKALMRLFVREEGLPGRDFYKNVLYTPNKNDGYRPQTLPGSMEALQEGDLARAKEWNKWLQTAIDKASQLLTVPE